MVDETAALVVVAGAAAVVVTGFSAVEVDVKLPVVDVDTKEVIAVDELGTVPPPRLYTFSLLGPPQISY